MSQILSNSTATTKYSKQKPFNYMIISLLMAVFILLISTQFHLSYAEDDVMTVYKSPSCGCCKKWITHLENNGFKVNSVNTQYTITVKNEHNIPAKLRSCHTGTIKNYVIEGHVPAKDIKNLLSEKSSVSGLAVPGMPMGSPGMEMGRKDKYSVLSFDKQGKTSVVANY